MLLRFSLNNNLLTILDEDTLVRIVNTLTAHVIPDSLAILAELHDVKCIFVSLFSEKKSFLRRYLSEPRIMTNFARCLTNLKTNKVL